MAKKSFGGGFDSLLSSDIVEQEPEKSKKTENGPKSSKMGKTQKQAVATNTRPTLLGVQDALHDDAIKGVKTTFVLKEKHFEQVQAIAYWERKSMKEVISEALEYFLKSKSIDTIQEALDGYRNKK